MTDGKSMQTSSQFGRENVIMAMMIMMLIFLLLSLPPNKTQESLMVEGYSRNDDDEWGV